MAATTRSPAVQRAVLRQILRSDLGAFTHMAFSTISPDARFHWNWHIDAVTHRLQLVEEKQLSRLLINQPPRSLKSICASVALPAFALGRDPSRRIIAASYSSDLASEFNRQFRVVVESAWYRELFPEVRWAKATNQEMVTTKGGNRYATSIDGTLTGRGADLIIIDDPLNAASAASPAERKRVIDWYSGSLVSRLDDKEKGAIVLVMQRLHEEDLSGHVLEAGGFTSLIIPAIATEDAVYDLGGGKKHHRRAGNLLNPAFESQAALDGIKREVGSLLFSAQYQQQPIPREGNLVKRDWFKTFEGAPSAEGSRIVQSWDVAMRTGGTNDYSVCTTWMMAGNQYFLLDVLRRRLTFPELRRKILSHSALFKADAILIEDVGPGMSILQDIRADSNIGPVQPIGVRPEGAKEVRLEAQSAKIEAGQVFVPKDAPWLPEFLNELLAFPNGRYDDQVDSVSQFLFWASKQYVWDEKMPAPTIVPRDDPWPSWFGEGLRRQF